jgi:TonB family protein
VTYEVALHGFDPVQVTGRIEGGTTLELAAEFRDEDRFYLADELEQRAEPIRPQKPELPYYLTLEHNRAQLQVTVGPNGLVKNVQVLHTTDPVFAKLYADIIAKWRFKPAMIKGRPVTARIVMPIAIGPTASVAAKN